MWVHRPKELFQDRMKPDRSADSDYHFKQTYSVLGPLEICVGSCAVTWSEDGILRGPNELFLIGQQYCSQWREGIAT
jgi:hypothetical protein